MKSESEIKSDCDRLTGIIQGYEKENPYGGYTMDFKDFGDYNFLKGKLNALRWVLSEREEESV